MDRERFQQIEEVFDATADAPAEERAAVLDRLCGDAPTLRAEVEALLAAAVDAPARIQDAIGRGAGEVAPPVPSRIGPYRLGRELGHGGMGTVYLAVRDDDEYRTEVAIKLIHHSFASAVARFRDERQILATLEHPGIVRLLDGGSTEERLPYLVMEHIAGAPITAWADARDLDVRARVELFCKVCAAVTYAHGKLVIHRDIKPTNILVTDDGTPKLLDFGIAKLLDPEAGRESATATGALLFTPAYAAPEQVLGQPVSTATDVYALGAVLYELLAGVPAHRIEGEGIAARRAALGVEPSRPSLIAPRERRRAIAGDLDNILLKALQKEPTQRYASVEQLTGDLHRHLDGLPVLARTGTWTYRAGKLIRRNWRLAAVTAAVIAAMTTATAISVWQARRADAQARRADAQAQRADEQARRFRKQADDMIRLANLMVLQNDRWRLWVPPLSFTVFRPSDRPDLLKEYSEIYSLAANAARDVEPDRGAAFPIAFSGWTLLPGLPALDLGWFGACDVARSLAANGRRAEALAAIERGLSAATAVAANPLASSEDRIAPMMCRFLAAHARHKLGEMSAVEQLLDQAAAELRALLATRPPQLMPYLGLVETLELHAMHRPDRRCALLGEAAAALRSWPGAPTPYTHGRQAEIEARRAGCR